MSDIRISPEPPAFARGFMVSIVAVVCAAFVVGMTAFSVTDQVVGLALLSASVALVTLAALVAYYGLARNLACRPLDRTLRNLYENDPEPVFVTDAEGLLLWRNVEAAHLGISDGASVGIALGAGRAEPEIALTRLLADALSGVCADDTVETEAGAFNLHAYQAGPTRVVWRMASRADESDVGADGLRLRMDEAGAIVWIAPRLLDTLEIVPETISDLLPDGPLRPNAPQATALGDHSRNHFVSVREIGDGLSEVHFLPTRVNEDDTQFDWLPVPLLQLEEDGTIARANRLARQLLSIEPDERVALCELVEGLGRQVNDWLRDGFEGRALNRPEVMRASRAVNDLFVQVTLDQVGHGVDRRMIALLHDATELKTLEAQFVQSQKMQAIGQLAGGVAHDFNNLLTAISGHCDLLLLRHDAGDPDFADLEQINQNANRAASLVGQLLAFSRKQNLRPETLDLRDILSDLTHLLNRLVGERVALSFQHDPALQVVRADKRQLEQVIMNLVVNARDAMPGGGTVQVRTSMRELTTPEAHDRVSVPPGQYVIVEVEDQGVGIPPDRIPKIFEPFFTTKRAGEGTGLGLSTAYGIVKQTGGYIFADSRVNEGTTFSLYFPACEPSARREVAVSAPKLSDSPRTEARILLVEDEAPVRAFAARALRLRGHTVIEAEHAEAALEIANNAEIDIDIFVTDVIMPGRDGPSWVREALLTRPGTGVVFVSGYAEESFAENQATIPNSTFLPKPFSLMDLTITVEQHFNSQTGNIPEPENSI